VNPRTWRRRRIRENAGDTGCCERSWQRRSSHSVWVDDDGTAAEEGGGLAGHQFLSDDGGAAGSGAGSATSTLSKRLNRAMNAPQSAPGLRLMLNHRCASWAPSRSSSLSPMVKSGVMLATESRRDEGSNSSGDSDA
jgi:hypothetical protein